MRIESQQIGPPDILHQGTKIYDSWNNIALKQIKIYKGWKPWELSVVFNPDPSQLSLKNKPSKQT